MDRTGRSWRPPPLVSSDWEPSRRHRNGGAPGGARDFMFTAPWLVNFPRLADLPDRTRIQPDEWRGAVDFDFELSPFIPFRDKDVCSRVRKITKGEIAKHVNPSFEIRVIEEPAELY